LILSIADVNVNQFHSYALQWLCVLPLEIIAASITIGYWDASLTRAIFVTIFLAFIIGINMFGIKGFGEAEFIFSIIKVVAVIGFMYVSTGKADSIPHR
jgi:yeast amino acid transporter